MDSSLSGDDIADQLRSSSPPSMFASRQQINDRTLNHSNSTVSNGFGLEELAKARIGFQAIKSTTSSGFSFADQSDDEAETTQQQIDDSPSDVKRVRRMISNRESARRSRRRKQDHLTQLEQQVSQVKVENSAVLKSLTDISQKYNEAAVDNRVLKANVETLRAKVKMAEESVKRVTGLSNPLFQAMSTIMMPSSFSGFPFESSPTTMPNHDGTNMLDVLLPMENVMIQQNPGDKIGRT